VPFGSRVSADADEQDVAGTDFGLPPRRGRFQVRRMHRLTRLEPGSAVKARQVEQHAAAHDAVGEGLDRSRGCPVGRCHQGGGPSVVHRGVKELVRERVHMRDRETVRRQSEPVAGVTSAPGPSGLAGRQHVLQRGHRIVRRR
jgi:hypothetical protein